ncbi:hypothetical protein EXZ61_08960 [Rhodoferax aquaticus]|uniref:Phospholipid/glycerol acyltransferase domain-containing protein n=2 Tax=Rhodoferax aquaticus TaxID=2527691 RepID=A0A515ENS2_9BURK|nr:hypothetical protein EXZ61_08960 [Rhodoferax aquaticus]
MGNAHQPAGKGSALARWLLGLFGWQVRFNGLPALQGVIIIYPHTSNWDFVVLILAKWAVGLDVSFWGKDSLFKIPLFGYWLRWIGGVPVVRNAPQGVVGQAVGSLSQARAEQRLFWLGLSPEGTRKLTAGWRSGFYRTAVVAQVPLGFVSLDYGQRVVDASQFVDLSGDETADFARIRHVFAHVKGLHPQLAAPIEPLPGRSAGT